MNDPGIDKLFKERLQGYGESPPEMVWNNLQNKMEARKRIVWWQLGKVAAALLIIACSLYLFNFWNTSSKESPVSQEIKAKDHNTPADDETTEGFVAQGSQEITPEVTQGPMPAENQIQKKIPANLSESSEESPKQLPAEPIRQPKVPPNQKMMETPGTSQKKDSEPLLTESPEPDNTPEDLSPIDQTQDKPRVTITYKRSPSPPEPTLALVTDDEDDKSGGIKWLWQKAQDLKNTELDLGTIRAAKDQLLVFDKKNKDKELKAN